MGSVMVEPNTCIRGCCRSLTIPLRLPPSSFTISTPIAKGAESVVYEAFLDGKRVAARKPTLSTSDDIDQFHRQLQLLCNLDHPGVAKLVAAHAHPPNYMFFFEFYDGGNLADKLHVDEWVPTFAQVLNIASTLAKTLKYLHNLGIVHRDVKPSNILLDSNLHPHLADFGLAEYTRNIKQVTTGNWKSSGKPTGGFHKKNMVGTLIYMAPEILIKDIQTEKSDAYSFGILFNEILTGVVPYTDLRAEAQAHTVLEMKYTEQQLTAAVVSQGLRPALASSKSCSSGGVLHLIQRCWDADPRKRPSFDDIVVELDSIRESCNVTLERSLLQPHAEAGHKNAVSFRSYQESVNWFADGADSVEEVSVAPDCSLGNWFPSSSDASSYSPVISSGSFASCGRREAMEDRHFLMPRFCDETYIHLFGIFDGHRGVEAAEFSAGALPGFLKTLGFMDRNPYNALQEAFIKTDTAFRKELNSHRRSKIGIQKEWHPGCTAVAALIVKNRILVANAGDCRTMLCRSGKPYALSRDHVASCHEERERVTKAGGLVKWQIDTWRVGLAALQVTRSIGDDDLKPAVTAEPEIIETILSVEDEYMVMASDGLWDVMSEADVIRIIRDTVKEPGMCSKRLATEATERGSKDNITVIVVFLRPVSTAERIY